MNGQNKCCSPSSSNECFCHYFTCKNELQELDKGMYKIEILYEDSMNKF